MTADSPRAEQRRAFVRDTCQADPACLHKASEDAAARSYWRLQGHAAVLMDAPPADNDLASWLAMRELLECGGVRVPRLVAADLAHGFVLMEDLGPRTMLQSIKPDNADVMFDAAIEQLLRLQAIAPPPTLPRYDAALLGAELDLFPDWFMQRELGLALEPGEQAIWRGIRQYLIAQALAQPQVLVHRDFMPRNLMPVDGELAVIDFQGAVTGPVAYDPLSLFKDAFVSWPSGRVTQWLDEYHARARAAGIPVPERERFRRDADRIGVQRHLKIIGIFARLKHRDGKPGYLADVPRFIAYLDAVLPAHDALAPLKRLLDERVWPAWRDRACA